LSSLKGSFSADSSLSLKGPLLDARRPTLLKGVINAGFFNYSKMKELSLYQKLPSTDDSAKLWGEWERFIIVFNTLADLRSFYHTYSLYYTISSFHRLLIAIINAPLVAYYQFSKIDFVRGVWLDSYHNFINIGKVTSTESASQYKTIGLLFFLFT